jgi:hypothetical protein
MVTQEDYTTWRTNFGRTAGAVAELSAAVPEPSTWLLLTLSSLIPSWSIRRRTAD